MLTARVLPGFAAVVTRSRSLCSGPLPALRQLAAPLSVRRPLLERLSRSPHGHQLWLMDCAYIQSVLYCLFRPFASQLANICGAVSTAASHCNAQPCSVCRSAHAPEEHIHVSCSFYTIRRCPRCCRAQHARASTRPHCTIRQPCTGGRSTTAGRAYTAVLSTR